ncbi:class I SAM-dependent methyltransferase [Desulfobotulus mexicanus]|uniref:Class I SAM-dependent methyltransferase n=1 Tax=Desulfobotulus mexicanus TaxID=2586642 RepID=A0A5S5MEY8_9BACT|nr:class I SAM-dependent methyltransferase [Desulfobotulus mexicanus]TYT74248.1 class I SAM-dependent methyltransferase [Desulfobotulus mexicanus]
MQACPLCCCDFVSEFYRGRRRLYWQCSACNLVFVDAAFLLAPDAEKAEYDLHENSPEDEGYRRFLSRLTIPLLERLGGEKLEGLDFGCGPGPALASMMEENGYPMALYDPYYAPDKKPLEKEYDFITCTEAMEHFYRPQKEWKLLFELLKPGGWLGIMTKLVKDAKAFAGWHYKNDPTHVSFFSRKTFEYMAQYENLMVDFVGEDVIFFQKSPLFFSEISERIDL